MAESGSKLSSGKKVVTTAGTRVQLPLSSETCRSIVLQALGTNEGEIVVGGENVVAKAGSHATPEQVGVALAAKSYISIDVVDSSQVWIDATKNGDGVAYTLLLA